jgi:hypothetical protein
MHQWETIDEHASRVHTLVQRLSTDNFAWSEADYNTLNGCNECQTASLVVVVVDKNIPNARVEVLNESRVDTRQLRHTVPYNKLISTQVTHM